MTNLDNKKNDSADSSSFFIVDVSFDRILFLSDLLKNSKNMSYAHLLATDGRSLHYDPRNPDRRHEYGFVPQLGPLSGNLSNSWFLPENKFFSRRSTIFHWNLRTVKIEEEYYIQRKNRHIFHTIYTDTLRSIGVQIHVKPTIEYYGSFFVRVIIDCRLHFPRGCDASNVAAIISQLRGSDTRNSINFSCKTLANGQRLPIDGVLNEFIRRVIKSAHKSPAAIEYVEAKTRSLISIERAYPWPISAKQPMVFLQILNGFSNTAKIRADIIDEYRRSEWGMFDDDSVIFKKDAAIRAHFMPRSRYRSSMYRYVDDAWIIAGLKNLSFKVLEKELPKIYREIFLIRRTPKEILKNTVTMNLIDINFFTFAHSVLAVEPQAEEPATRRAYHQIQRHYRLAERRESIEKMVAQIISEAERWNMPILGPITRLFKLV